MNTKIITALGIGTIAISLGPTNVSAQECGTVIASSLNVRTGPGINNSVKGYLHKGDNVIILGESDGWLNVQLPNKATGWVSAKYISISSKDDSSTSKQKGIVTVTTLNVRSGAGTNNDIISKVHKNEVLTILEESNNWFKIQLSNSTIGWVSGDYVKIQDDNNENIVEEEVNLNGRVSSNVNLNVRSGPGTNYSIKSSLSPGRVVFLLTKSNGWYKIQLSDGTEGWISSSYVSINQTYGKATVSLNVRSGPSTQYSVKTTLIPGEVVTITGSSNSWYEVKTNSNLTGWVSSRYIEITDGLVEDDDNESEDSKNDKVIDIAMKQLGKPYVWGGNGPNSFDCSGFTRYVYLNARNVSLPRVSYEQAKYGQAVATTDLKKGDLLHFATVSPGRTSHVGIYIGNNEFIHASGSQTRPDKVKIDSLTGYYKNVLLGARRF